MSDSHASPREAIFSSVGEAVWSFLSVPLATPAGELAGVVLLAPMLLAVAFWNGFPLIFYDTGAYLLEGVGRVFLSERSPVYSLFIRDTGAAQSFWYVVAAQAVMTAFAITELARAETPELPLWKLLAIGAALTLFTGIAWYVGQVEPDCMAALVVIAVYLLAFRLEQLGIVRAAILTLIGGLSAACHPSHLGLAAGLVAVVGAIRLVPFAWRRVQHWPRPHFALPAASFALGVALVLVSNHGFTQRYFISRSGPVFIFARFLQDGIVKRLLDDTCPGSRYALCAYKNDLPQTANAWLWRQDSPFFKLGHFEGTRAESERIVWDSLKRYPMMNLEAAAADTVAQFLSFGTGDGIVPQQWVLRKGFRQLVPRQLPAYLAARQQRNEIDAMPISILHIVVGAASLLGLGALLWRAGAARRWDEAMLPAFVLVALLGNAFICGALSNPHDRYQSRLIWLPTLVLALSIRPEMLAFLRRPFESGT